MMTGSVSKHPLLSVLLGSTSVLCWAYMNTVINVVPHGAPVIVLTSSSLALIVFSPIVILNHDSTEKGALEWRRIILLTVFGLIDTGCALVMMTAVKLAPVGNVICLWTLRVIWTPLLDAIIRKSCISPVLAVVSLVAMIGAILLTKPPILFPMDEYASSTYPYKMGAEIGATIMGFLQSLLYFIYNMYPDLHWSAWQLLYAPVAIPLTILLIALNVNLGVEVPISDSNSLLDFFGLVVISTLDQCGKICRSLSAEEGSALIVSLSSSIEIPFSYLFAWIFVGQPVDWMQGLGASFIVACVLLAPLPCMNIPEKRGSRENILSHAQRNEFQLVPSSGDQDENRDEEQETIYIASESD